MPSLKTTSLNALHHQLKAKLVPFAGYEMPVQYEGIMAEHKHTRAQAGLFDVSHMGQCVLTGDNVCTALQSLVTADIENLALNQQTYSVFTNENGGIEDDLIITRWAEDTLFLVVNAACKEADFTRLDALNDTQLRILDEQALIALQGPKARAVLSALAPQLATLTFMNGLFVTLCGQRCYITCSGYTGEDGYEISCPNEGVELIAKTLLANEHVKAIGLGARDSLRLEAGLCLYGHDLDSNTTPIEASLNWAVAKSRRATGGFNGDTIILAQLNSGTDRKRVGFAIEGRAPVREGAEVFDEHANKVGHITSGGFSPSLAKPIAMGYLNTPAMASALHTVVRGKHIKLTVTTLPFVPQHYYRG